MNSVTTSRGAAGANCPPGSSPAAPTSAPVVSFTAAIGPRPAAAGDKKEELRAAGRQRQGEGVADDFVRPIAVGQHAHCGLRLAGLYRGLHVDLTGEGGEDQRAVSVHFHAGGVCGCGLGGDEIRSPDGQDGVVRGVGHGAGAGADDGGYMRPGEAGAEEDMRDAAVAVLARRADGQVGGGVCAEVGGGHGEGEIVSPFGLVVESVGALGEDLIAGAGQAARAARQDVQQAAVAVFAADADGEVVEAVAVEIGGDELAAEAVAVFSAVGQAVLILPPAVAAGAGQRLRAAGNDDDVAFAAVFAERGCGQVVVAVAVEVAGGERRAEVVAAFAVVGQAVVVLFESGGCRWRSGRRRSRGSC